MTVLDASRSLLSPDLIADPFPFYKELQEQDPVHWSGRHRAWLVTKYEDVRTAFNDPRLSVNRIGPYFDRRVPEEDKERLREAFAILESWLVFTDAPVHTRLRGIVQTAFTPRTVARQSEAIASIVADAARNLRRNAHIGTVDVVRHFARPISATVMAHMLNIDPAHNDRIDRWTDDLAVFMGGDVDATDRNERVAGAVSEMLRFLEETIENYSGDAESSVIGGLIAAENEGEKLTKHELLATCVLLLFGGYRTTACSITNALNLILRHPDIRQRLVDDPELVKPAVDEFMRYEGHARIVPRFATADIELRDRTIRAGERVLLVTAAANRDPDQFPNPDEIVIDRKPNAHLTLGSGIHYCLGGPLSRAEQQSAIRTFLTEFPRARLHSNGPVDWEVRMLTRTPQSLLVDLG
ncbi:cytochrome P450 [Rhodococcus sp. NPDC057014]|uniref:cytochrome P450 n=1 Tax=Rhodococcus sp. NPDC057014 TaxID=3346000 RepID=UPI0036393301